MKPATKKRDAAIWKRWTSGDEPKAIMADEQLTAHQFYGALRREKQRQGLPGDWKPGKETKKNEKKRKITKG